MNIYFSPVGRRGLPSSERAAFTLIELLVVISIIAVLAGLLLPVVGKVTDNAKKVSAKATETQIVASVNNYQTEYGQYPVVASSGATTTPSDTTFDGTGAGNTGHTNGVLMNVLRALNTASATDTTGYGALNSRRIVYFEGKNVKTPSLPKDGFIVTTGGASANGITSILQAGDLVDPWGNEYFVRIDTNYTNAVLNPYAEQSTTVSQNSDTGTEAVTAKTVVRTGAIAWSYGPDGKYATGGTTAVSDPFTAIGDDVASWQ